MQYLGHRLHARRRCLHPAERLSRQSQGNLRSNDRRRGDRRRHRSAHRRTDPHAAGELPRGRSPAAATHHRTDGDSRDHPFGERRRERPETAPHPAPPLPRHRKRPSGRRLRRSGPLLRHRRHVGAAYALRAAAAGDPGRGVALRQRPLGILRQPVRRLRAGLLRHVVRRAGRPHGPSAARNGGRTRSPCGRSARGPPQAAKPTAR